MRSARSLALKRKREISERSERDYSSALRILRDDRLLASNSTLGIMSGYGSVLRKLHRKREAKAIEQDLKAFAAATHPQ